MSTTKQPNHLRVVMAEQNTTNRWLATELGVAEMTISRWSTNKINPLRCTTQQYRQDIGCDIG